MTLSRSETSGLRRARAAQAAEKRGDMGFYVVNAHTRIAVAGPFHTRFIADGYAQRLAPPTMAVYERKS